MRHIRFHLIFYVLFSIIAVHLTSKIFSDSFVVFVCFVIVVVVVLSTCNWWFVSYFIVWLIATRHKINRKRKIWRWNQCNNTKHLLLLKISTELNFRTKWRTKTRYQYQVIFSCFSVFSVFFFILPLLLRYFVNCWIMRKCG